MLQRIKKWFTLIFCCRYLEDDSAPSSSTEERATDDGPRAKSHSSDSNSDESNYSDLDEDLDDERDVEVDERVLPQDAGDDSDDEVRQQSAYSVV
jgi:hypothetical protein